MKIEVIRCFYNDKNTIGRMLVDGKFFAYTLEDKERYISRPEQKVKNETAIPYGNYKVVVTQSARFKRLLPELLDVPFFDKIRIHGGNTEADTEGCILVGANTDEKKIWNCRSKVDELTKLIMSVPEVTIEIKPEFPKGV